MPIEQKNIGGKLNTDVSPYKIPPEDYVDALNVTRDSQSVMKDDVVSNIVGNTLVAYTQPAGINICIGSKSDPIRNRVYYWVWNSNGNHYIVYWDRSANAIIKLIINLIDTNNVDILKFNPSYRVNHIDIINRDDNEGDLIFWTDALNQPRKINELTATTGGYGSFYLDSFLDVAKEPPSAPPYPAYIDDTSNTVNNVHKKLFVFKTRFVYDDLEKSVPSSQSIIPLPPYAFNPSVDQDPTKNCAIEMVLQSGQKNVTKIEVWGAQSLGNEFGQWFLIESLVKADLSIADDDIFPYKFYNNQAYNFVNPTESTQLFDYVPQKTNSQALLNGNVLAYAGITENYDLLPSIDSVVATTTTANSQTAQFTEQLVVANVLTSINGLKYIRIFVIGKVTTGDNFFMRLESPSGIANIGYNASNVDTPQSIANELASMAIAFGYTVASTPGDGSVLISQVGSTYLNYYIQPAINTTIGNNSVAAFDWNSHYQFNIVYFDSKGRTNSAIGNQLGSVITPNYAEVSTIPQLPVINLSINYRPPSWATYFQMVRTDNLTKSSLLYWISDRTFQDTTADNTGYQYAYVSIASLNQFILDNPTATQLAYGFTPNDRIRFVKRYAADGTTADIYSTNDFEIQASLLNPVINGVQQQGQILKLILPTNLSTDFNFGGNAYANYLVELYTPALSASNNLNEYYEFGERYLIGNAGTSTAYHFGKSQNQSTDLVTPALFLLIQGDNYYRQRSIQVGNELKWNIDNGILLGGGNNTIPLNLVSTSFNDPNYTPSSYDAVSPVTSSNQILTVIGAFPYTVTFKITGFITILVNSIGGGYTGWDISAYLFPAAGGAYTTVVQFFNDTRTLVVGQTYTYNINATITMSLPSNSILSVGSGMVSGTAFQVQAGNLVFDVVNNISSQGIIDGNYSDFYPSKVNSNGRAFIYDENAKQQYNPVLIRNGGTFEFGTNINNINRFYGTDFDQYDRSNGDVMKLFVEGRNLYIFQKFDTGIVPILQQVIEDVTGNPLQAQSNLIINKIQYPFKGKYGIGDLTESFAYFNYAKYFVDNNKNVVVRISQDGVIAISKEFDMNAYFTAKLPAYQATLNNGNGATGQPYLGNPTVYGCFDFFTNKYIISLQEINRYDGSGNLIFHQDGATLTFNEVRNPMEGFESFVSFLPENMVASGTLLCSFKNGQLWSHNNSVAANFYGVQYDSYITLLFNKDVSVKKRYLAVAYQANGFWVSPTNGDVTTSMVNPQTGLQQISQIIQQDYELNENVYYAALNRDANSRLDPVMAVLEGDYLNGNWIAIKFKFIGGTQGYMLLPYLNYIISPRNF